MGINYMKLPVDFSKILKGDSQSKCLIEESIAQYIMMQITSRYGEVVGKNDFGSDIWELEFNQLVKINKWEENVRSSLLNSIVKYETRLTDIVVHIRLSEIDVDVDPKKHIQVRRQALIHVLGNIKETGLPFNFNTTLYVSPLSQ